MSVLERHICDIDDRSDGVGRSDEFVDTLSARH
jgi:hypothetical protein